MQNPSSLVREENPHVKNRKRRKQSLLERELWEYVEHYTKTWVYPDCPRSWSTNISRELGYGDGWFSSVRKKNTSVCVSTIKEVCDRLNELRPPTAPKISPAAAFLGAERRITSGQESIICLQLPLIDQIVIAKKARQSGKTVNDYVREMLLRETRKEILK